MTEYFTNFVLFVLLFSRFCCCTGAALMGMTHGVVGATTPLLAQQRIVGVWPTLPRRVGVAEAAPAMDSTSSASLMISFFSASSLVCLLFFLFISFDYMTEYFTDLL
jgi:hypothetical protein